MLISPPKRMPSYIHEGPFAPAPLRAASALALGALLLAAAGCESAAITSVRTHAANDFQCNESELRVEQLEGRTYRAQGCGQSDQYTCFDEPASRGYATVCNRNIGPTRWRSDAPRAAPLLEPPSGAGGFAFGATEDETRGVCQQAGHVYAPGDPASCDGVVAAVGAPARAALRYCAGKLCSVSLQVELPQNEDVAHGLARWRDTLASKYGGPSASQTDIPDQCLADVTPCLLDRTGTIRFDWHWRSHQSIALLPRVHDAQRRSVELDYAAGETTPGPTPGL